MICDITQSIISGQTLFIPAHNSAVDAIELNSMLEDCFPYNNHTFHLNLWDFHLVCAGGYDNAIAFGA